MDILTLVASSPSYRLAEIRAKAGLSQRRLEITAGTGRGSVCRIERAIERPYPRLASRLSKVLADELGEEATAVRRYIFGGSNEKEEGPVSTPTVP